MYHKIGDMAQCLVNSCTGGAMVTLTSLCSIVNYRLMVLQSRVKFYSES